MKIKSISIDNFRSIREMRDISLSKLSIFVGPNDAGKSNILIALVMAYEIIIQNSNAPYQAQLYQTHTKSNIRAKGIDMLHISPTYRSSRYRSSRYRSSRYRTEENQYIYDWRRDFPIDLRENTIKHTIFTIDFTLNNAEKIMCEKIIKTEINEHISNPKLFNMKDTVSRFSRKNLKFKFSKNLRIVIKLDNDGIKITFFDTERPEKPIPPFINLFIFIKKNVQIEYMSAIRSTDGIMDTIQNLISGQLYMLENEPEFKRFFVKLQKEQVKKLNALSKNITHEIQNFLRDDVKSIKIHTYDHISAYKQTLTSIDIEGDINTQLEMKGDGLKNIISILIMQYITKQKSEGKNIVFIIEEPESHLHPEAIRKINSILTNISIENQVIISTHSPLLIDRNNISNNIIVNDRQAQHVRKLSDVREILGVRISDNLQTANVVVLVEGDNDIKILKQYLSEKSSILNQAFEEGFIIFVSLHGANNAPQICSMWHNSLCHVILFMDDDQAARIARTKAINQEVVKKSNAILCIRLDKNESEIEDFIKIDYYKDLIKKNYDIDLSKSKRDGRDKKWADRIRILSRSISRPISDEEINILKNNIADIVLEHGSKSIINNPKPILALKTVLENYVNCGRS